MNLLDVVILLVALMAALGGYQLGLVTRIGSWAGLVAGLGVGAWLVGPVVDTLEGADSLTLLGVATALVAGGAVLGQSVGLAVGTRIRRGIPYGPGRTVDRVAGGAAGAVGVGVVLWLLLPALVDVPVLARPVRTSAVIQLVDDLAPPPPQSLQALRGMVGRTPFPEVFAELQPAPQTGPPPDTLPLSERVQEQVADSTVAVEALGCGRLQEGSGFVAAPGLVVSNAHVVAGADTVEVLRTDGSRLSAEVVVFDDDRDLAVLRVDGLDRSPLPLGDAGVGTGAAVFGYPRGQNEVRLSPAEIRNQLTAVGRDIYGRDTVRREIFVLAADLDQGDSGAAVVDPEGDVVAVAFAIAPDRPQTAYALTSSEVRPVLADPGGAVGTGPCL